jgi:hypothetical protein
VPAGAPPHTAPSRSEVDERGNWLTVSSCRKCWHYVYCSLHVPATWLQLAPLYWTFHQLEENIYCQQWEYKLLLIIIRKSKTKKLLWIFAFHCRPVSATLACIMISTGVRRVNFIGTH